MSESSKSRPKQGSASSNSGRAPPDKYLSTYVSETDGPGGVKVDQPPLRENPPIDEEADHSQAQPSLEELPSMESGPSPEEIAAMEKKRAEFLNGIVNEEKKESKFHRKNFEFGSLLGEGAYARVFHARLKSTNEEFAIKMMEKKHILRYKKEQTVSNERTVLAMLDHPNLMRMHAAFQDSLAIYFVLDLCPGGELFQQIKKSGRGCPLDAARFYVAEIVLALEYLHRNNIIHRDLKPENVLLNAEGHMVLTDFGTSRLVGTTGSSDVITGETRGRKNSFVGTAEYVCPELLKGEPAGFAADLWSLGCLVYTLLVGKPAFRGASEYLTFQKILSREFSYPADFPEDAKDLVEKLLAMNPSERLGAPPTGFGPLKKHRFFKGIDFSKINSTNAPAFKMLDEETNRLEVTMDFEDAKELLGDGQKGGNTKSPAVNAKARWKRFLLAEEEITKHGYVSKRRGLFAKRRMLILTSLPRFVYIDPEKMEKKGEIPWSNSLWAEMKNETTFYIHTPNRSYYMQGLDTGAKEWVEVINSISKSKKKQ